MKNAYSKTAIIKSAIIRGDNNIKIIIIHMESKSWDKTIIR